MNVGFTQRALLLLIAMGSMTSCTDSAPYLTITEPDVCTAGLVATSIDAGICTTPSPMDAACLVRWKVDTGVHPGATATIRDDALVLATTNQVELASVTALSTVQLQGDFDVGIRFSGLNTLENVYFSLNIALVDNNNPKPSWLARVAIGTTPVLGKNGVFLTGEIGLENHVFREGMSPGGWLRYRRRGQRLTTTATFDDQPALQNETTVTTTPLALSVGLFGVPSLVRIERIESSAAELNDEFRCNSLAHQEDIR